MADSSPTRPAPAYSATAPNGHTSVDTTRRENGGHSIVLHRFWAGLCACKSGCDDCKPVPREQALVAGQALVDARGGNLQYDKTPRRLMMTPVSGPSNPAEGLEASSNRHWYRVSYLPAEFEEGDHSCSRPRPGSDVKLCGIKLTTRRIIFAGLVGITTSLLCVLPYLVEELNQAANNGKGPTV